ncbi:hypothetical protein RE628_21845 [Paenibacillus sp. D2_2]|uniref:hypothetical protein n=1 Tax=Paenibacillus sp. D2_2 TaxID=3073092 RepID=UPI0028156FEF|nr:hypothetical protein [Paenibacillus sp. D2_2]WMT39958.1 hypothetical protein RE628_21845 [Paenibacillus sp. D2_2]
MKIPAEVQFFDRLKSYKPGIPAQMQFFYIKKLDFNVLTENSCIFAGTWIESANLQLKNCIFAFFSVLTVFKYPLAVVTPTSGMHYTITGMQRNTVLKRSPQTEKNSRRIRAGAS